MTDPNSLIVWVVVRGRRRGSPQRWHVPLEYGPGEPWASDPLANLAETAIWVAVHLEEWWHTGPRGPATRLL